MDPHSHMNHGDMGHGDHSGHDMPMQPMCSMNMLFTWKTENLCIFFESWRITDTWSLLISLLAIVILTAGYEAVRDASRRFEQRQAAFLQNMPPVDGERSSLLGTGNAVADQESKGKLVKAAFYAVQVFYSFFIMLLFMTYNGWVMIAVGVGAFIGYLLFSGSTATRSAACH